MAAAEQLHEQLPRSLQTAIFVKKTTKQTEWMGRGGEKTYVRLETLEYSETHRSGGHFDVEINQQP